MEGRVDLEQLAAASRQAGGIEIPVDAIVTQAIILTPAGALGTREPLSEVMRLREEALATREEIRDGNEPETAEHVWLVLTGPNGLPLVVDPTQVIAVQAAREE